METGKAEVTKPMCGFVTEKTSVLAPYSGAAEAILPKILWAGLLISKYRVLSILYRRHFLNIDGVIANTCETSY